MDRYHYLHPASKILGAQKIPKVNLGVRYQSSYYHGSSSSKVFTYCPSLKGLKSKKVLASAVHILKLERYREE